VKVRIGGKNREQKVFKKEDGGLAGCHDEKHSACDKRQERKGKR